MAEKLLRQERVVDLVADFALKADAISPTFTTPNIGVASSTSVNKVAITPPATGATFTLADGKTFVISNTITLVGTDGTTMTFPNTSANLGKIPVSASVAGSDVTTTSNVAANITGLSVAVEANKIYKIMASFFIGCNNTGGLLLGISGPAGSAIKVGQWSGSSTSAFVTQSVRLAAMGSLSNAGVPFNRANTTGSVSLLGYITISSTAGNITFQFASAVNTQTSTVYIGSTFDLTEVQ